MTDYTERLRDKSTWADGWQTRGGSPARLLCTDRRGGQEIIGLYGDGAETLTTWAANGRFLGSEESCLDLIPRPVRRKAWMNVYREGTSAKDTPKNGADIFSTREIADLDINASYRIACIEIEYTEGEGLE